MKGLFGFGLIVGIVVPIALFVSFAFSNNSDLNRWTSECNHAGGLIAQTHATFFTTRYECYVNSKQVTLPGWEGK